MFCIDASVIVSAANPKEPYFFQSRKFLLQLQKENSKVFLPEIIIPEITSGFLKAISDPETVYKLALSFRNVPNFSFIPVDKRIADLASWIICKTGLKGTDAIYVALALDYNLELITLDKDQLEKSKGIIKARKP
jgi:predicted nucleic acid-binding protein